MVETPPPTGLVPFVPTPEMVATVQAQERANAYAREQIPGYDSMIQARVDCIEVPTWSVSTGQTTRQTTDHP